MKTTMALLIVVVSCVGTVASPSGTMLTDPPACANYENVFHWEGRGYTESQPEDIAVTETHIYIASLWLGLEIVDWTDPGAPILVSQVRVVEEGSGLTVRSVAVGGSIAVVKQGGSPTPLFVVDVTDPENPELAGSLAIDGGSSLAVAEAGCIYAASDEGVQVIDAPDQGGGDVRS